MEEPIKQKKTGIIATIIVVLVLVGAIVFAMMKARSGTSNSQTASETSQTPAVATEATSTEPSKYKDGTWTAEGSYISPEGPDKIAVTLTLANGVVTDANVVSEATMPTSRHYQGIFISNYKQYVVGKNIDAISLDKVSGSSLTPKGFNDALAKIKIEAQA